MTDLRDKCFDKLCEGKLIPLPDRDESRCDWCGLFVTGLEIYRRHGHYRVTTPHDHFNINWTTYKYPINSTSGTGLVTCGVSSGSGIYE